MASEGIYRRGDRWVIVVNLGIDPKTGKRKRKCVTLPPGTKKKEAETERTKLLRKRDTGELIELSKQTLADFLTHWQRTYVEVHCRPKTITQYEYVADRYIVPLLGRYPLAKLTPAHVREAFAELHTVGASKGKPLGSRSLALVRAVLHRALEHAVKWQLLARNVADGVEIPKAKEQELRVWTADEARHFLEVAATVAEGPAMALALLTGMRLGEVCGLRWQDVDGDRSALQVVQAIQRVRDRGIVVGQPKTASSRRRIALSGLAADLLRAYKVTWNEHKLQAGASWQDTGLVFVNPIGEPISPPRLQHVFARTVKAAGLPRLSFHGLRHTHASLMLANNENPKVVAERLGHSNISITMNVYSHLLPGLQESAATRLDNLLRASAPTTAEAANG